MPQEAMEVAMPKTAAIIPGIGAGLRTAGNGLRAAGPWAWRALMMAQTVPTLAMSAYGAKETAEAAKEHDWKKTLLAGLGTAGSTLFGLSTLGLHGKALNAVAQTIKARRLGQTIAPEEAQDLVGTLKGLFGRSSPAYVTPYKKSKAALLNLMARRAPGLSTATTDRIGSIGNRLERISAPFNRGVLGAASNVLPFVAPLGAAATVQQYNDNQQE